MTTNEITRRNALGALAAVAVSAPALPTGLLTKVIPRTGEALPAIGMGSWRTFDVGGDKVRRAQRTDVLRTFFAHGGSLIDSSPMYGSAQSVIGAGLKALGARAFAADKVWTEGQDAGIRQIEATRRRWSVDRLDLLQIHNLLDWEAHLPTLIAMKERGAVRYLGVTSYAGLRYDTIATIMQTAPIDFIQVTYNVFDREAEARLLPMALDRGIAVIANRPFREGALIAHFRGKALPGIAIDLGASSWAQLLLKFIVAHPAIAAAIPATTRTDHMAENMTSARGAIPDAGQRAAILKAIAEA